MKKIRYHVGKRVLFRCLLPTWTMRQLIKQLRLSSRLQQTCDKSKGEECQWANRECLPSLRSGGQYKPKVDEANLQREENSSKTICPFSIVLRRPEAFCHWNINIQNPYHNHSSSGMQMNPFCCFDARFLTWFVLYSKGLNQPYSLSSDLQKP